MDITVFPYLMFDEKEKRISVNLWSRSVSRADAERAWVEMEVWAEERQIVYQRGGFFWDFIDVEPNQMLEFRLMFEGSTEFA